MEFNKTNMPGLFLISPFSQKDERGSFVKTYHKNEFEAHGLKADFRESYYSESVRGVIRGMHFQVPPHQHIKLVYATAGEVVDVVVDLRKGSPTFRQFQSFNLSSENKLMLYIPEGLAHGFCVTSDKATMVYCTGTEYNQESDAGIRYDSFGFHWPVSSPILSERDKGFAGLDEFDSPF